MNVHINKLVVILAMISGLHLSLQAQEIALFRDKEPLKIVLVTDVIAIQNDKSEDPEYISGMLLYNLSTLKREAFDIKVKARGNTRRVTELCEFPPLKFNFKKSQLKNTVFDGVDKIKFVSQCRLDEPFAEFVKEEYMLYNVYNQLTEYSYKTRLVEIEIKDYQLRVPPIKMTGFLIEDDDMFAQRINAKEFNGRIFHPDSCASEATDVMSLFQYMIGNTDWYINTRHNIKVFQLNETNDLIPVAYDFDFSGVINTPYASPSRQIPIRSVTQRYFKGSCRDINEYFQIIKLFNDKQTEIYSLYNDSDLLTSTTVRKSLRYFNKFYKIINDPDQLESSFDSACNQPIILQVQQQ